MATSRHPRQYTLTKTETEAEATSYNDTHLSPEHIDITNFEKQGISTSGITRTLMTTYHPHLRLHYQNCNNTIPHDKNRAGIVLDSQQRRSNITKNHITKAYHDQPKNTTTMLSRKQARETQQ